MSKKDIADFVDPDKEPSHYIQRYLDEPEYKSWFERNYPEYTIYEAVGISESEFNKIKNELKPKITKREPEPEPKQTQKTKTVQIQKANKSKLENKKILIIVIIGAIILISVIAFLRLDYLPALTEEENRPPGVGPIGSEHVHGEFAMLLDWNWVDLGATDNVQFARANDYIFMLPDGSYNIIHREATGATLELFFESLGVQYTGDCIILPEGTRMSDKVNIFERVEYCNNGIDTVKLFVNGILNDEKQNYVIQDEEELLLVYDNRTSTTRSYRIN